MPHATGKCIPTQGPDDRIKDPSVTPNNRPLIIASAVTGVGLSGFFDGIVLHQILRWHHLLSLVPGESMRRMENQILADGLFHVLMYAITATGLYLLWRSRSTGSNANCRSVAGGGLLGFGAWNLTDVGLFHWVLGIHRLRVDVPDPLLYDIAWLAVFGAVPLIAGWLLFRSTPRNGDASGRSAAAF